MTDSLRVTGGVRVPQFRGSPIADRELWIVSYGSRVTGPPGPRITYRRSRVMDRSSRVHGSLVTGH